MKIHRASRRAEKGVTYHDRAKTAKLLFIFFFFFFSFKWVDA